MYAGQITILYILKDTVLYVNYISTTGSEKKERKRKTHYSWLDIHNLEGWDGVAGERKVQEGGDIHIPMADSCWCMAETNTIL